MVQFVTHGLPAMLDAEVVTIVPLGEVSFARCLSWRQFCHRQMHFASCGAVRIIQAVPQCAAIVCRCSPAARRHCMWTAAQRLRLQRRQRS